MSVLDEARRLATVATVFVTLGWFFVIYAIVAGVMWFVALASTENVNWLEALGASLLQIGMPIFLSLIVAGLGHFLRLFAMDVASRQSGE